MKQAFLRLAGLKVAETAVELNWACASDALSKIATRRLQQSVNLCFEISIDGQKASNCQQWPKVHPNGIHFSDEVCFL